MRSSDKTLSYIIHSKEEVIMSEAVNIETPAYLATLEKIATEIIAPAAMEIDQSAQFPRAAINALGEAGLLGLVSAKEVGGKGETFRAATLVVERIARECASTAMIVCMHYSATAVIEAADGPRDVREAIAAGKHLTTLAFSEAGSRSHFWVPISSAEGTNGTVTLNAKKSFSTAANQVDSYVWSSRPLGEEGLSTIWLVPGKAEGLQIPAPFDGLGLRGNFSSPISATNVSIPRSAMLGKDGSGFDLMMSVVLPYFQLMSAAVSIGLTESSVAKAAKHVTSTPFQHLSQNLTDLPTIRAYMARMRMKTDMAHALMLDTLNALETNRPDAMLRVLEVKAAAAETALEVTELAMRVCGGAAFRKEVGIERHFRDARAASIMSPTTDILYDFIGKAACGLPLF
jgi:alkylation response protein AidB-like acyl-CoA dehydrogenase